MSENRILIIKFIINAIKDVQRTLKLGHLQDPKYIDVSRSMVCGLCLSIQRVAEQFDGQSSSEPNGFCAWGTILLMRDYERKDIDESIAKALKNFEEKLTKIIY